MDNNLHSSEEASSLSIMKPRLVNTHVKDVTNEVELISDKNSDDTAKGTSLTPRMKSPFDNDNKEYPLI